MPCSWAMWIQCLETPSSSRNNCYEQNQEWSLSTAKCALQITITKRLPALNCMSAIFQALPLTLVCISVMRWKCYVRRSFCNLFKDMQWVSRIQVGGIDLSTSVHLCNNCVAHAMPVEVIFFLPDCSQVLLYELVLKSQLSFLSDEYVAK